MAVSTAPSRSLARRAREAWGRPEVRTELTQLLKATLATMGAWAVAQLWLGLDQPFLAPWAALLTVHATVVRSVSHGLQSVAATFLGLAVSSVTVLLLGSGLATLGLAVLVGLLIARLWPLRDEGVTVATTALFVLTSGYATQEVMLMQRFADTVVGVAVGLLVNLLIVPPLDDHLPQRQLGRVNASLGALMRQMSEELSLPVSGDHAQQWIEETRRVDRELDRAEELVRFAGESHRWNFRRTRSRRASDPADAEALLVRLEEGVAQVRIIARVVGQSVSGAEEWDPRFRGPWLSLLDETGARIADPEATLEGLAARVDRVVDDLSSRDLPGLLWTVYGTLLHALRTVIEVVDDVGSTLARH